MTTDSSDQIAAHISQEEVTERIVNVLERINAVDPANIQCMMGITVMRPEGDSERSEIRDYAIGDDDEIPKMIMQLIEIARTGMQQADADSTNESGVTH